MNVPSWIYRLLIIVLFLLVSIFFVKTDDELSKLSLGKKIVVILPITFVNSFLLSWFLNLITIK